MTTIDLVLNAFKAGAEGEKIDYTISHRPMGGQKVIEFEDGSAVVLTGVNQKELRSQTTHLEAGDPEQEELMNSFGGRLGALIVEYSECLSKEERSKVLEQLTESTSCDAYSAAISAVADILRRAE